MTQKAKSASVMTLPSDFAEVFQILRKKIHEIRFNTAVVVNQHLIKLYWEIGKTIFQSQSLQKWGSRDIESLGNELQKAFPGISGFSRSNLFKMRSLYLSYEKVSQTVRQFEELPIAKIPWGHNIILITKIKDIKERLWYAHMTIEEGSTRDALEDAILSKYFHRHGKAITNFKPEYAGKINFYLSAVDEFIKSDADNPSIGLILCKTKKQFTAEYALRDIHKPMGVSQYADITTKLFPKRLQKSLPSIREIEAELSVPALGTRKTRSKKG